MHSILAACSQQSNPPLCMQVGAAMPMLTMAALRINRTVPAAERARAGRQHGGRYAAAGKPWNVLALYRVQPAQNACHGACDVARRQECALTVRACCVHNCCSTHSSSCLRPGVLTRLLLCLNWDARLTLQRGDSRPGCLLQPLNRCSWVLTFGGNRNNPTPPQLLLCLPRCPAFRWEWDVYNRQHVFPTSTHRLIVTLARWAARAAVLCCAVVICTRHDGCCCHMAAKGAILLCLPAHRATLSTTMMSVYPGGASACCGPRFALFIPTPAVEQDGVGVGEPVACMACSLWPSCCPVTEPFVCPHPPVCDPRPRLQCKVAT